MEETELYELLYTSKICLTTEPSSIAPLIRHARNRNARENITGILVFDGQHFCQYLEGPSDRVLALSRQIAGDSRHEAFSIKHQDHTDKSRRFPQWNMAYAISNEATLLECIAECKAQLAVDMFMRSLSSFSFAP